MTDSFRMTTAMATAMGYDQHGNAPDLLSPKDAAALEDNDWKRADGNAICWICNSTYYLHPRVQGALWLRRTCDQGLVKL